MRLALGKKPEQKGGSSKKRKRVGKIAPLSRVSFFLRAEFQVWRDRNPQKSPRNTHFPLGCDALERRDRGSGGLKRAVPYN